MYLRIVKLRSGQHLPVIEKKKFSVNCFNLENPYFYRKYKKTYVFTQFTVCSIVTHSNHTELKSGALFRPSTKQKISAYPIGQKKTTKQNKKQKTKTKTKKTKTKISFIKKSQKYVFLN